MTERMRFYNDFAKLTTEQYEHCTLEEKLSVYVQHRPACIVPFLEELVNEVGRLEEELTDVRDENDDNRNTIIELREAATYD